MKKYYVLWSLLILLLSFSTSRAQDNADPYVILEKHYDTIGGLEKLEAVRTEYAEATVEISGMPGTFKQWRAKPLKNRNELDLSFLKQVSGDNGEFSWGVDANGKVKINKDEATLKRREINRFQTERELLNRNSETFTLHYDGLEKVNDVECHVIRVTNSINDDYETKYINTVNFLMEKSVATTPDNEMHNYYSDYREVDGIMRSFSIFAEPKPIGTPLTLNFTEYKFNIDIDPALFEPPGEDVRDFEFTGGEHAENLAFSYIGRHLYIMVNIDGKERLWCLDTGAGMTVIDSAFARSLGLELEGNIEGAGAGNAVNVQFTELPPYSLEGVKFDSQRAASINIAKLFHKIDLEVYGILGYDFLSRFVVKVDYANELISFYDPDKFEYRGEGVVIEAPLDGNIVTAPMTVDGTYSGQWRVDLGAGSIGFNYPFAAENGLLDRPGVERIGLGAGGEGKEKTVRFESIEFAGYRIDQPLINIPEGMGVGAFASAEYIGNIGNELLQHFVIYIDYKNQKLIVEKGDNFNHDFPRDKSGLQIFKNEDDEYVVRFCAPGTPSEKAGFKEGDIVRKINDIDIEMFDNLTAVRELLKAAAGTEYIFTVERDGEKKKIKLELKELYG